MSDNTLLEGKKMFLDWSRVTLSLSSASSFLLDWVSNRKSIVRNIRFVDNVNEIRDGLYIEELCEDDMDDRDVTYYTENGQCVTDVDRIISLIKNRESPLPLEIYFSDRDTNTMWANLCESPIIDEVIDNLFLNLLYEGHMGRLDKLIDANLQEGNTEELIRLSNEKSALMVAKPEKKYKTVKSR